MKHELKLETECNSLEQKNKLLKLFEPEDKDLSNGRSTYTIKENDLKIVFLVKAKDAVALRATITSITKVLDVYEKINKVILETK